MSARTISLTSDAFEDGARIPTTYTADGDDLSPPLTWTGVPAGTRALALLCEDPDAPSPRPWVHWLVYDMPPETTGLPPGVPREARLDPSLSAAQGANSWPSNNLGYRGPAPPRGHGVHHYHFVLHALDRRLSIPPGADRQALARAMEGHVLATGELVGTYRR